jgi:hypothetical protein
MFADEGMMYVGPGFAPVKPKFGAMNAPEFPASDMYVGAENALGEKEWKSKGMITAQHANNREWIGRRCSVGPPNAAGIGEASPD